MQKFLTSLNFYLNLYSYCSFNNQAFKSTHACRCIRNDQASCFSSYSIFYNASSNFLRRSAFYFERSFIIFSFSLSLVFLAGKEVCDLASSYSLKLSFSKLSTLSSSSTILSSFSSKRSSGAPTQF